MLNQNELTQKEQTALKALIKVLYAEVGFSDVIASDLQKACGFDTIKSMAGVISSLSKKGYVCVEEYHNGQQSFDFLHLSDDAERFHPEHAEELGIKHEELI